MHRVDDSLDQLRYAQYVSSMYLKSGYLEIMVDKSDFEKTYFFNNDELHEFKALPLSLCSTPATCHHVIDTFLTVPK